VGDRAQSCAVGTGIRRCHGQSAPNVDGVGCSTEKLNVVTDGVRRKLSVVTDGAPEKVGGTTLLPIQNAHR